MLKAKNSKHARVMKPAVSTTMPPASTTTQKIEIVRKRAERPGKLRLAEIIARNERPRPVAARS